VGVLFIGLFIGHLLSACPIYCIIYSVLFILAIDRFNILPFLSQIPHNDYQGEEEEEEQL